MLREELKKIWRPGILLALAILGFVFYTMFLEFYIEVFPENYGGADGTGVLAVSKEWVETYGTELSEDEMDEIRAKYPMLEQEADRYVREYEIGKKHGLETYAQYAAFSRKALEKVHGEDAADKNGDYADAMRMGNYLQSEETGNIEGRMYAIRLYTEVYRIRQEYGVDMEDSCSPGGYTQKEYDHARKTFFGADKKWQNILPWEVTEATGSYAGYLMVWICLSTCLLLSPLLVHDRLSRMQMLQYSSKLGRKIWKSQLAAVMVSSFFLTTINLVIFGGLFAKHGTHVFFPCRMYSFMSETYSWPDQTYGMWCLVLAAMCYLTAFGTAGAVFFLSLRSANHIVMLLKLLPLFVGLAVLCPKMADHAFYYSNPLYRLSGIPYIEGMCAAGVLAIGVLLSGCAWKDVKKELC